MTPVESMRFWRAELEREVHFATVMVEAVAV
jgi:hypothetical protein